MTDDDPAVPIVCTDCGTEARIPLDDVADKLESHNARHHDGEEVATVDPELADQLADLVVDDMGLLDEE
jgi:hypothetical protein